MFAQAEKSHLPRVAELEDAVRHLKTKRAVPFSLANINPARAPTELQSLQLERALLDASPASLDDATRGYIRAVSWDTHSRPELSSLLASVDTIEKNFQAEARRLAISHPGEETRIEQEFLHEHLPDLQAIRAALAENACGENAKTAVCAIESLVARAWKDFDAVVTRYTHKPGHALDILKKLPDALCTLPQNVASALVRAKERLLILRPIRDQLYFQYIYAPWCETAPKKKAA